MGQILLIEDDADLADIIAGFMRQKGHTTIKFDNSEKALEDIVKQKVTGDIILTDLKMPGLSGFELIKKLHEQAIQIPIIVMTSHKTVESAVEAVEVGAFDFVVKPLHFPQLYISIERAIHFSRLKDENKTLKSVIQIKEGTEVSEIKGKSTEFLKVLDLARRVAKSKANVFITGESGTGKEVIAKAIHHMSDRKKKPFVAINCSAIPEHLLESELFGHAKGAFTGASDKKVGLFEEAEGGTLFLDEIGDMSLQLQAKLLRVLQERKVRRVGENQSRNIDVRVLSATHKDLVKEIKTGKFREDLFFRLRVIPISIPPLRERKDDILPLTEFFLKKYSALNEKPTPKLSKETTEWLMQNSWKGNVRELENTIERAVVLCQNSTINVEDFIDLEWNTQPSSADSSSNFLFDSNKNLTIDQLVKQYIQAVLKKNKGAKDKTAKDLDIDRKTLYRKLQEIETETGALNYDARL
ncbi:MAG: sigma-54 dependent transcriptional regulator [Bdellovibrionales bacterium]|nr:sigma-54 dependent transcriptional regulator [Bdellovibrionales bacterium]